MRLRKVSYAPKLIAKHPERIMDIDKDTKVDVKDFFPKEQPLEVEIGAGKGQFSHTLAQRQPDKNHIAIERFDSVIVRALEKVLSDPLDNLFLVRMDAKHLENILDSNVVKTLYLNFSDPWPKARHAKRRLTHPDYLSLYKKILAKDGRIEFKTDNRHFFEYTLKTMNRAGMTFHFLSFDLHEDNPPKNIMTEFEEKHSKNGPIYKLTASFEEDEHEKDVSGFSESTRPAEL